MGEKKADKESQQKTWWDTAYSVGENLFNVADFLGEVFAEFFGMTQSRYQWAIDAYERQQRWEREEKEKEEYHKKLVLDEMRKNKKSNNLMNDIQIDQNDIKLAIDPDDGNKYERI